MLAYEKIATILRTDKDFVKVATERLAEVVGHDDAAERIVAENDAAMKRRFAELDIADGKASDIYRALIEKVRRDDAALLGHLGNPKLDTNEGCGAILAAAQKLAARPRGYFLKRERAQEFLRKCPPKNTLSFFKLASVDELLARYDVFEVYSALRFVEDKEWLNTVFFKQLDGVTPADFEEREISVFVLHDEWLKAAETFLKKKYHNVSHLKELGCIFIIPIRIDTPGEAMRLFTLVLHYLHEVTFYSNLFRRYAALADGRFAARLVSALRGDVLDAHFPDERRGRDWMIVQQYLAKLDPYDWRLFEPHVNPEAIHWSKAEDDIARFGSETKIAGLGFWSDLDFVGDFFPDESGIGVLVSFNLIDTVMSLVEEQKMVKFLYHHQEALWNKIFAEYLGREKMEQLIVENFERGVISLGA